MMMHARPNTPALSEIEQLLLVQEPHLDKFKQELATRIVFVNVAHAAPNPQFQGGRGGIQNDGFKNSGFTNSQFGNNFDYQGCGCNNRATGCGKGRNLSNCLTCQLWGKYVHAILNYWFRFDESFMPTTSVVAQPVAANTVN